MKTKLAVAALAAGMGWWGIQTAAGQYLDYGDAPEGALAYLMPAAPGAFPTCIGTGPAGWIQHGLGWAHFGATWDAEIDGNAGFCPLFNPNTYNRDECFADGDAGLIVPSAYTIAGQLGAEAVVPCAATPGGALGTVCQSAVWGQNVDILVVNGMPVVGYVNMLVDWDQNGAWGGTATCPGGTAPEHVLVNFPVPVGFNGPLSMLQPPGFLIGPNSGYVWCRFTVAEQPVGLPWTGEGQFEDGETEDYLLRVDAGQQQELDFGDAPDPTYPTLLANNGARHVVVSGGPWFGDATDTPDPDTDGQPDATATGDDLDIAEPAANDDEDGVAFSALMAGQQGVVRFELNCPAGSAYVDAWVDWDMDGAWAAGEQIVSGWFGTGTHTVPVTPPGPNGTTTFARFRVNSTGALGPTGLAADGEVEDLAVYVAPVKWLQPPDLTTNGVDVANTLVHLADDFLCTASGPITDIHIWTSLFNNEGWTQYTNLSFSVFLYADVPAGPDNLYSHPGELIWSRKYAPGDYQAFVYSAGTEEWWHDPLQNMWEYPGDSMVFEYDFYVPQEEAFLQTKGTIYWLGVKFDELEPGGIQLGWKTSSTNWNDDACWLDESTGLPIWQELRYGDAHPLAGKSMDFAFAVTGLATGEPDWDFGDAPDGATAPGYPTLLVNNGARHVILSSGPWLGDATDSPDADPDGQPDATATGDDQDILTPAIPNDDEDGVAIPVLTIGQQNSISFTVQFQPGLSANVDGWIDWNQNGTWENAEQIVAGWFLPGTQQVQVTPPAGIQPGTTFARFRINSSGPLVPTGPALDGEVEDYEVLLQEVALDFGDAPDGFTAPGYPTLLANNGARHVVVPGFCLGNLEDAEQDGQPDPNALGDDNNPPMALDDEDGVSFPTALFAGVPNRVQVVATVPAGVSAYFSMWIDYNGDGDWTDAGEQAVVDNGVVNGTQWYPFTPGAITATNSTFVRCRLSTVQGLSDQGPAPDGEVEDYEIPIVPVKWIQRPDPTSNGVDVDNAYIHLADDFRCTMSGPITDIHIWTSFYQDLAPEYLTNLAFTLFIYKDVPASGENYSHPGDLLWSRKFVPGTYQAGLISAGIPEWWHDPAQQSWISGGDSRIYQYDFYIPKGEEFVQTEGLVYWLGVKYEQLEPGGFKLGWKSSNLHFNDDACWLDESSGIPTWRELRYGGNHPLTPDSMDLAFALTGIEGEPPALDFGDAPDGLAAPGYPTLLANNGARHVIVPGVCMGNLVDTEADGQPDATATGDDYNNADDEEGVNFTSPLYVGGSATFDVMCSAAGFLSVWIDFNADGDWTDAGENIFSVQGVTAGTNTFAFVIPGTAAVGNTFMRFRYTTWQTPLPDRGLAPDGEVEDYQVAIEEEVEYLDFGDAWDSMSGGGYPTLLANNGARHAVVRNVFLGNFVDVEPNGQPTLNADGDDNNPPAGVDDEDGVTIPPVLVAGSVVQVQVVASVPGFLNAWIDFNANGTWIDPGEQAFFNWPLNPGLNVLPLNVPPYPATMAGGPHSRWRFTSYAPMFPMFTGAETDGEVEDYEVHLEVLDFGDAPDPAYPTQLASDGARHRVPSAYYLGIAPDQDPDGQPDAQALGDDNANVDDEDLVAVAAKLVQGAVKTIVATASTNGYLNVWIDFNADGDWADLGEQAVANLALVPGTNDVAITTPQTAKLGPTFGRVRFCSYKGLSYTGLASDGEVEDHAITIYQTGPDTNVFRITNIVYAATNTATIWWASESNVTYQTQWASNLLSASNVVWTTWGSVVIGPANTQTDTNAAETARFYRVVAPWAPQPP